MPDVFAATHVDAHSVFEDCIVLFLACLLLLVYLVVLIG
jgi:hypothetical protein